MSNKGDWRFQVRAGEINKTMIMRLGYEPTNEDWDSWNSDDCGDWIFSTERDPEDPTCFRREIRHRKRRGAKY
jgi:hypothetical protein